MGKIWGKSEGYGGNSGEAKRRSEQPGVRAARRAQARAWGGSRSRRSPQRIPGCRSAPQQQRLISIAHAGPRRAIGPQRGGAGQWRRAMQMQARSCQGRAGARRPMGAGSINKERDWALSHSPGAVNTFQFRAKLAPSPEDQAHVLHFTPTARAGRRSHDTRDLRISEPALGFRLARLRDAFSRVGMRKIPPTLPGGSEPGWNSSRGFKKL